MKNAEFTLKVLGLGAAAVVWMFSVFATNKYVETLHGDIKIIKECIINKKCEAQ